MVAFVLEDIKDFAIGLVIFFFLLLLLRLLIDTAAGYTRDRFGESAIGLFSAMALGLLTLIIMLILGIRLGSAARKYDLVIMGLLLLLSIFLEFSAKLLPPLANGLGILWGGMVVLITFFPRLIAKAITRRDEDKSRRALQARAAAKQAENDRLLAPRQAFNEGRVADALRMSFDRERYDELRELVSTALRTQGSVKKGDLAEAGTQATEAIIRLRQGIGYAKGAGVAETTIFAFSREVTYTANALWHMTGRLHATIKQQFASAVVAERLRKEQEKIERIADAAQQAHEGLLLLTMSDGGNEDIRAAEHALRGLREMAEVLDA